MGTLGKQQVSFDVKQMTQAEFAKLKEEFRAKLAEVAKVSLSRVQVSLGQAGAVASLGQRHLLLVPLNVLEESAESGAESVIIVVITDAATAQRSSAEPSTDQAI